MTKPRIHLSSFHRFSFRSALVLVAASSLLAACALQTAQPTPDLVAPGERAQRQQLEKEHQKLEVELARQRLILLEKEGQIKVLSQKLDAAIREVVRAMAKLQGLESKAEAASNLAEAEIALNLLERDGSGREKDSDFIQATQLLKASTQEFKKENYGGALYLASQAKSLIKGEQARSISGENMPKVEGEVPFSLPLSLRVLTKSNIREGPGPNFKIVFVVEEGARLTGQSHKGLWVRVKSEDGRWGWIFYKLLGPQ